MQPIFITGTDTDCGKTYITCELLNYLNNKNQKTYAIKPIATGFVSNTTLNMDELELQKNQNNAEFAICHKKYKTPVSPNIAAGLENESINLDDVLDFCTTTTKLIKPCDYLLIEGAGGILVPLNKKETWLDFISNAKIPVIIVVGIKLGCINHALLTESVILNSGNICYGWIANCIDKNNLHTFEVIDTLKNKLNAPLLAQIAYQGKLETIAWDII